MLAWCNGQQEVVYGVMSCRIHCKSLQGGYRSRRFGLVEAGLSRRASQSITVSQRLRLREGI